MKITLRNEAKEANQVRYFTGKPCPKGHIAEWNTKKMYCQECRKIYKARLRRQAGASVKVVLSEEERRATKRENARKRYYMASEAIKLRRLEGGRKYRKNNREKCRARRKAGKLKLLQAMPKWETYKNLALTYSLATIFGDHVDHIVPLNSPLVCGLHCAANLQCLSPEENMKKGNRTWPDMPWIKRQSSSKSVQLPNFGKKSNRWQHCIIVACQAKLPK